MINQLPPPLRPALRQDLARNSLWAAAREIARIPVPYQQATGAPLGERKRERERTDSEAGSWVIGLGGSHAHGDKQGEFCCQHLGRCSPQREPNSNRADPR
ncbi:hypothetical protein P7K49_027998 [Saguinus oedipus]|uniref:Uncharacterized protein n=1 Tax=Saguinus oedipus TaxID=9490 RepID=A0ABQ9UC03_SAGOE|nr:hypothetical protein P7K49_027998 [Saguinus oedipus]